MWTVAVLPMLVAPAAGGPFAFPSMLFFGKIRPAAHGPEALLRAGERSVAAAEREAAARAAEEEEARKAEEAQEALAKAAAAEAAKNKPTSPRAKPPPRRAAGGAAAKPVVASKSRKRARDSGGTEGAVDRSLVLAAPRLSGTLAASALNARHRRASLTHGAAHGGIADRPLRSHPCARGRGHGRGVPRPRHASRA